MEKTKQEQIFERVRQKALEFPAETWTSDIDVLPYKLKPYFYAIIEQNIDKICFAEYLAFYRSWQTMFDYIIDKYRNYQGKGAITVFDLEVGDIYMQISNMNGKLIPGEENHQIDPSAIIHAKSVIFIGNKTVYYLTPDQNESFLSLARVNKYADTLKGIAEMGNFRTNSNQRNSY